MKSMTFDEFFALPPGTIFGQATGRAHDGPSALYRKLDSYPDDGDNAPSVAVICLSDVVMGEVYGDEQIAEHIYGVLLDDAHRFLIYEAADLDRLAGMIGRGPGWMAHRDEADGNPGDPRGVSPLRESYSAWLAAQNVREAPQRPTEGDPAP